MKLNGSDIIAEVLRRAGGRHNFSAIPAERYSASMMTL